MTLRASPAVLPVADTGGPATRQHSTGREFLDTWTDRMATHGYARISEGRCPRRLAGKRHRNIGCWCVSRLNDHAATYRRHGQRVVLWEPYQASPEDLTDVFAAARADGLSVILHGSSLYNPGSTLVLEFSRAAS